ncbi:metalloproteinase inhibitor 4 [Spea bombifrons]|uniref:metalloproteinase inhibitor 4 n=1 Tax=Spea bombifrons TaxID=233779 RepID=UPI00234BE0AC|nr:metalloproteinase inhibitor 4 [Spea bombifrons]
MTPAPRILCFALLLVLTLYVTAPAEACSCLFTHPQQQICDAQIVISAKIICKKVISMREKGPDPFNKYIQYEIKMIKMFKGFGQIKDIQYAYTPAESSLCGVSLDTTNKRQYLLTGHISEGKLYIMLCNLIKPWEDVSFSLMKILNQKFQMGCDCKIVTCYTSECALEAPNQCLWTDWLMERQLQGPQANNYACIKRSNGSCSWYRIAPYTIKDYFLSSEP